MNTFVTVEDLVLRAIDETPGADGLVNGESGCGCLRNDLAPCGQINADCALASAEVLIEPRGECQPGDLWFTALSKTQSRHGFQRDDPWGAWKMRTSA
jgi:hypothetical protein